MTTEGTPREVGSSAQLGLVERLRSRAWEHRYHMKYREEAATEIDRLRALAEHLRHCRECGETDVANCFEGKPLWDACMPKPAAEIGGA